MTGFRRFTPQTALWFAPASSEVSSRNAHMIKNVFDESRNQRRVISVNPMAHMIRSDKNAVRCRENPLQFVFDLEAYDGTAIPLESAWRCRHHDGPPVFRKWGGACGSLARR